MLIGLHLHPFDSLVQCFFLSLYSFLLYQEKKRKKKSQIITNKIPLKRDASGPEGYSDTVPVGWTENCALFS